MEQVKTWQKVLFYGSILTLIIVERKRIFRAGRYIKNSFQDLVVNYATGWIGVKEIGSNQSFANDTFQKMLEETGWTSGEEWCMYFAKAVHLNAFKDNPEEQSKINRILNGSSQNSYQNAQRDTTNTYTVSSTPTVGDIVIYQNVSDRTKGHAGIVTKINSNDNKIETVEGNTSSVDIGNGDYVAKKTRTSIIGNSIGGGKIVRGFIRKLNV